MATEDELRSRIEQLVVEEHELRERRQRGEIDTEDERARLDDLEAQLDQCWDLLRQRRARIEAGQHPDEATPRPVSEVENYLQ